MMRTQPLLPLGAADARKKPLIRIQQGFTLLETVALLILMLAGMAAATQYLKRSGEQACNQAAAIQLKRISHAALRYVNDHAGKISRTMAANPSESYPLTLQELRQTAYLPSLAQLADLNAYGQGYQIELIQVGNHSDRLRLVVFTTAGTALPERSLQQIAAQIGAQGGYISALQPDKITGSHYAWQLNWPTGSAGHLASLQELSMPKVTSESSTANANQLLQRTSKGSSSSAHQMETDLQMQQYKTLFQEGSTKSALGAQQLSFSAPGHSAVTLTPSGVQIGDLHLNTQALSFYNSSRDLYPSELQAQWNKLPLHVLSADDDVVAVWSFADELCTAYRDNEALGRLFLLGQENENSDGLFICGKPADDGYGPSEGGRKTRAYLITRLGEYSKKSKGEYKPTGLIFPETIEWDGNTNASTANSSAYKLLLFLRKAAKYYASEDQSFAQKVKSLLDDYDKRTEGAGDFFHPNQHAYKTLRPLVNDYNNGQLPSEIKQFLKILNHLNEMDPDSNFPHSVIWLLTQLGCRDIIKISTS